MASLLMPVIEKLGFDYVAVLGRRLWPWEGRRSHGKNRHTGRVHRSQPALVR